MNLIQQEKDLQSFSDQALLQEAMQPSRGYAPYMVQTEIARRTKEREDYQKQMMAQQAQQASPVAQQNIDRFVAQNMAAMQQQQQPQQMPAEGIMAAPGAGAMPQAAAVDQAMGDAMAAEGIMAGAPVQGMAEGGGVRRMLAGRTTDDTREMYSRIGKFLRDFRFRRPGEMSEGALRSRRIAPEIGEGPIATPSSAPGIASSPEAFEMMNAYMKNQPGIGLAPDFGRIASNMNLPTNVRAASNEPRDVRRDTGQGERRVETPAPTNAAEVFIPEEIQVSAKDPYWSSLRTRLSAMAPSKEEFERESRAATLAGLGALIGGATRRGDIAAGLSQLAGQQIGARRDFRREQREFEREMLGLRGQERAEARADTRERESIARDDARFNTELRLKMMQIEAQRRANESEARARMQAARNDAERLEIQRLAAQNESALLAERRDLLRAQAEYYRGRGSSQNPFDLSNRAASAEDLASALE